MKAVLLISHGSRSSETKKEVSDLVIRLRNRIAGNIVEFAFLELESPSISEGIDLCVRRGAKEIIVLLNFLNSGRHVDTDIPRIVHEAQNKHTDILISISKPVGQHPRIEELFLDLIHKNA